MAALTRSPAVEFFWKFHRALYAWTNGFFDGRTIGMPVLLLTTTGRRSRQPRTPPLTYLDHGDAFVVFASCLGEPKHPAWWLNLEADPSATVQIGGQRIPVRAREAEGRRAPDALGSGRRGRARLRRVQAAHEPPHPRRGARPDALTPPLVTGPAT